MTGRREFIKRSAMGLTAGIAAVVWIQRWSGELIKEYGYDIKME